MAEPGGSHGEPQKLFMDFVLDLIRSILRVVAVDSELLAGAISPCVFTLAPWLTEPTEPDPVSERTQRVSRLRAASFNGELHIARAGEILARDTHLAKCCVGVFDLIRLVDKFALQFLVPAIRLDNDEELKRACAYFENLIYGQGKFRKVALSHLFNFVSPEDSIDLGGFKIARVPSLAIARALGDSSNTPFTQHPGVGNFFIVVDDSDPCANHIDWIYKQHAVAANFSQLLPYFKDGVVHLDYSAVYFAPDWVNDIRKGGVFFVGTPRRFAYEQGLKPYHLEKEDIPRDLLPKN